MHLRKRTGRIYGQASARSSQNHKLHQTAPLEYGACDRDSELDQERATCRIARKHGSIAC